MAVKQVFRIGRGDQKCHLLLLLADLLIYASLLSRPDIWRNIVAIWAEGEGERKGRRRGHILASKSMSKAFLFGTSVQLNRMQYVYRHRGPPCMQSDALSDKFAVEIHSTLGYNGPLRKWQGVKWNNRKFISTVEFRQPRGINAGL